MLSADCLRLTTWQFMKSQRKWRFWLFSVMKVYNCGSCSARMRQSQAGKPMAQCCVLGVAEVKEQGTPLRVSLSWQQLPSPLREPKVDSWVSGPAKWTVSSQTVSFLRPWWGTSLHRWFEAHAVAAVHTSNSSHVWVKESHHNLNPEKQKGLWRDINVLVKNNPFCYKEQRL